jgi:glycerophosphoryl diester phosphodiesterase
VNPLLDPNLRLVVAHRGNRAHAPENTLEAFRQAESLGADALELDVRMSRDGVAMVIHDATVDRTTDGAGQVSGYTRAELQSLNAAARFGKGEPVLRIPRLDEVFETHRNIPIVIEVKELAAADATAALVRRFDATDRVIIGSAKEAVVQRFYGSGIACCAAPSDAKRLIVLGLLGRTPRAPRYQVLSVTPRYRGLPIPVAAMAAAARRAGIPTQVWTVNSPETGLRLWNSGVAAIVTDDPGAMLRIRPK